MFIFPYFNLQGSYDKGRLKGIPLSQCLTIDTIHAAGLSQAMDQSCIVYKAVVNKEQTIINSETPIVYNDSQQQVYTKLFNFSSCVYT